MANLIPWDTQFEYKKLERTDTSTGRVYKTDKNEHLPSVTTILDKTKDKSALKAWAERVGQEEADRIKTDAAFVGTNMHLALEMVVSHEPLSMAQDWRAMRGYEMAFRLVNTYFQNLTKIYGSEVSLHFPGKYAGTTDLIAEYRGKMAVVDFKQSVKQKRHQYITDYYHQLAAYAMAHDKVHGTKIDYGVVLVSVQDGTTQEFTTAGKEFEDYKAAWWERVEQYWATRG
jgi:hypothetical protein